MKAHSLRRDVWTGALCMAAALAVGFVIGAAPPMVWAPPPMQVISAAEARAVPLPAERFPIPPIDRAIDQLFFWPAGPGPGAGR